MKKKKPLSPSYYDSEDYKVLWKTYAQDKTNKAVRNRLIVINMPLIYFYLEDKRFNPDEFDDLLSEAAVGLIHAVEQYDPDTGNKFSTYAYVWMHRCVQRYQQRNLGGGSVERGRRIGKISFIQKIENLINGRRLNSNEIVERTGYSKRSVDMYDRIQSTKRFEIQGRDGGYREVVGYIPTNPAVVAGNHEMVEMGLKTVHPLYREALRGYFMYDMTLQELGEKLNVSRERARQLVREGLFRVRRNFDRRGITLD